ncbi:heparinase II/III family protein [Paenibacillus sp. HB172176]|uniref:heparinase II/III domain-containing protein n=1 Tax=Paenibacillus sp. HB172176 TaxID=2493690 RepID=UPI00143B2553|nr:heparinase II/III family protein [Paenibacillus sp. HB172176]
MLQEIFTQEKLRNSLQSREGFRPFPRASDRQAWEDCPAELRAYWTCEAEAWLGREWPVSPAIRFLDFKRDGNRSRYEKLHFERRNALGRFLIAECMENDGRFVEAIIDLMWAICEESFWGVPAHNDHANPTLKLPDVDAPYIDLFASETGAMLAWALYLLEEKLDAYTPEIARRVRRELKRRITDVYLEHDDFFWMGFRNPQARVNNWNVWCNSNCLAVFLLEEQDEGRRELGVAKIIRSMDRFLESYGEDGGCDEGPAYWGRAGGSLFDALELLYLASGGELDVYHESKIAEMGRFVYRVAIHHDYVVNFADGRARANLPLGTVYAYGRRIGDDRLMALGSLGARHAGPPSTMTHFLSPFRVLQGIFEYGGMMEAPSVSPYVRDSWLGDIEVMTSRELEESGRGLYVAAKGGHNDESHNHNDVGNLIVFAEGKPILIDPGAPGYNAKTFSSERYTIWTMQSAWHNTPAINGFMQRDGADFRATNTVYRQDGASSELEMELMQAYPEEAGVRHWKRSIRLVRGEFAEIQLEDLFELAERSGAVTLHFITPSKPLVGVESFVWDVGGGRRVEMSFDNSLWQPSIEPRELTDEENAMQSAWHTKTLYRLTLHLSADALAARSLIRLKMNDAKNR